MLLIKDLRNLIIDYIGLYCINCKKIIKSSGWFYPCEYTHWYFRKCKEIVCNNCYTKKDVCAECNLYICISHDMWYCFYEKEQKYYCTYCACNCCDNNEKPGRSNYLVYHDTSRGI